MKHRAFLLIFITATSFCQAECKYLLNGDINRDCKIDLTDFSIMAANWLQDCTGNSIASGCRCDIPWIAEPPMNVARDQFAGGVINGKIYVFGGNGKSGGGNVNLKSTEMYDPATKQWTMLGDNNHNNGGWGVEELTSAVVNGKLYVFGAYGGTAPDGYHGVFNFNEMYDPVTDTWTTLAQKPTTVASAPATVYDDKIFIFGGYFNSDNPSQEHDNYDIVESYDPNTNTWSFVTNMPKVLSNFGLATIGNKAYLFGGIDWTEPSNPHFNESTMTYDFQTDTWETSIYTTIPVTKAFTYANSAPVINGKVYLIGGWRLVNGEFMSNGKVDIYESSTDIWEEGTSLPLPLGSHVTVNNESIIYIIGGANNEDFANRSKTEMISYDTGHCSE